MRVTRLLQLIVTISLVGANIARSGPLPTVGAPPQPMRYEEINRRLAISVPVTALLEVEEDQAGELCPVLLLTDAALSDRTPKPVECLTVPKHGDRGKLVTRLRIDPGDYRLIARPPLPGVLRDGYESVDISFTAEIRTGRAASPEMQVVQMTDHSKRVDARYPLCLRLIGADTGKPLSGGKIRLYHRFRLVREGPP